MSSRSSSHKDSSRNKHRENKDNRKNKDKSSKDEHRHHNNDRNRRPRSKDRHDNSPQRTLIKIKEEPQSDAGGGDHHHHHQRPRRGEDSLPPRQPSSNTRDSNKPPQRPFKKRRRFDNNSNEDQQDYEWGRPQDRAVKQEEEAANDAAPKAKPEFGLSGKLAEDTNTYNGVVIKYNEPQEARKPKRRWRLYPFKGETSLPFIPIHRQSAYLLGRERAVCDIPTDHPSCSKQHAVLQFRLVDYQRDDGSQGRRIRPYVIDLESSNGTFVNNKQIESKRYVELIEQDVVKFGFSTREYVILHENSKEESDDDDVSSVPELGGDPVSGGGEESKAKGPKKE